MKAFPCMKIGLYIRLSSMEVARESNRDRAFVLNNWHILEMVS